MHDLGMSLVELSKQVDWAGNGHQDQLHFVPKRAPADFVTDLPELVWKIERFCPKLVRGEEENSNHLRPHV
jgi:hypothetical protein